MRDPLKARHIKVFTDENGRKTAVDCDEVALVRKVCKYRATHLQGYLWELTLRSGATVCIDYDVMLEDLLVVLDMT